MAAYAEGVDALARGDSVAAAPALAAATEADPEFVAAWVRLSRAYEELGTTTRRRPPRSAPSRCCRTPGRRLALGVGRCARSSPDSAATRLRRGAPLGELVARYPNDAEARLSLAEAQAAQGRLADAGRPCSRWSSVDPNHPRAWYLLGKYAILGGDYRRAVDDYLVRSLVIHNRLHDRPGPGRRRRTPSAVAL